MNERQKRQPLGSFLGRFETIEYPQRGADNPGAQSRHGRDHVESDGLAQSVLIARAIGHETLAMTGERSEALYGPSPPIPYYHRKNYNVQYNEHDGAARFAMLQGRAGNCNASS